MCFRVPQGRGCKASSGCLLLGNDVGVDTVPVLSPMANSKIPSSESCWSLLHKDIQPASVIKTQGTKGGGPSAEGRRKAPVTMKPFKIIFFFRICSRFSKS